MDTKISINENMSLGKRFFKYLAPSVVAMWVFSLYTMVDGIFVSKGVGELALVMSIYQCLLLILYLQFLYYFQLVHLP